MRDMNYIALDGNKVRSEAEQEILNFFIMHNLNGKYANIIGNTFQ